jgi:hypothetical protein
MWIDIRRLRLTDVESLLQNGLVLRPVGGRVSTQSGRRWSIRRSSGLGSISVTIRYPIFLLHPTPERASHRAFGLREVGMETVMAIRIHLPGELPEPMDVMTMDEFLNKKEGYEITEADQQMMASGQGQLVGQFLIDRCGIVRWSFTEVLEGGLTTFKAPNPEELASVASQVVH